jgi:hypothetical protein
VAERFLDLGVSRRDNGRVHPGFRCTAGERRVGGLYTLYATTEPGINVAVEMGEQP